MLLFSLNKLAYLAERHLSASTSTNFQTKMKIGKSVTKLMILIMRLQVFSSHEALFFYEYDGENEFTKSIKIKHEFFSSQPFNFRNNYSPNQFLFGVNLSYK